MIEQRISQKPFSQNEILEFISQALEGQFRNQSVLVLIPDHTRSIPLPVLFRSLVEALKGSRQVDFLVALGTHPPLSEDQLCKLVGITVEERRTHYSDIGIFNHSWNQVDTLETIGVLSKGEIQEIAGDIWHPSLGGDVPIRINKAIFDHDHILILGPTFPHEVVGFSGGVKYLFPGISGPEMINVTHWMGALIGVVETIGIKDTRVRAMIQAAADKVLVPLTLIAAVVEDQELIGLFIGDCQEAWRAAADLSAQRHIQWHSKPFQRVLSCAPQMYDELWTAAKAMYKLEPVMAPGGEIIVFAPHLDQVSLVHEKLIYEVGYHVIDYFLDQWERYQHIPLCVLAHSTHLRGAGTFVNNIEKPNLKVTLASQISPRDCERLNLGYYDPAEIKIDEWLDREDEGVLYVPKAGETLFRVRDGN